MEHEILSENKSVNSYNENREITEEEEVRDDLNMMIRGEL